MDAKPKILFVCIGNSCRSQMAEGFARFLSGGKAEVFSAGSRPSGFVHPSAIRAMREIGIDISNHTSKSTRQVPQERYDAIVTMGCGDACPHLPAKKRFDWQIPDPSFSNTEEFNRVRNLIRSQVTGLLKESNLLTPSDPELKKVPQ